MITKDSSSMGSTAESIYLSNADKNIQKRCREREDFYKEQAYMNKLIDDLKASNEDMKCSIKAKDSEIAKKDSEIATKDSELAEKKTALAKKNSEIAEKDALLKKYIDQYGKL